MSKRFKPLSLGSGGRRITGITNFAGVDFTPQRFKIHPNRAIDALNFIYKDGVIQKRTGYEELFYLEPTHYIPVDFTTKTPLENTYRVNENNFNGLWQFVAENGKQHIVAHIGKLLYEIKNIGKPNMTIEPILTYSDTKTEKDGKYYVYVFEFENYKSSAFVGANRLYFLGGNKYMVLRFLTQQGVERAILEPVENNPNTFVPTTTISITYEGSAIGQRTSLDKVNLLSKFRKNELLSGTHKVETLSSKTQFFEYVLDSPIVSEQESDLADILIVLRTGGMV